MSAGQSVQPPPLPRGDPLLEYVTMPNCRDCRALEQLLAEVTPDFPKVEIRAVPADSARGRAASLHRGVLRFPVILLNDEIIGIERIAEGDLRWFLEEASHR